MADPVYFKPKEVADRLRVPLRLVYRWLRNGELRSVDVSERPGVGRARFRIYADALADFEDGRRIHQPMRPARRRQSPVVDADFVEYV